ncbi:C6 transcription factor [Talaromyces proteolyticus]|uniref:C6 transcription factor n=1 Tax=Talaromyces proteolyticus TaxID=1131652 RepID=A0AAD4KSJ9_9EURO|nr:C6 transcription factor [Talaromyces proteolyticus]KAH8700137.1 C6 transcription factor [Talaromyces proteolyticus]
MNPRPFAYSFDTSPLGNAGNDGPNSSNGNVNGNINSSSASTSTSTSTNPNTTTVGRANAPPKSSNPSPLACLTCRQKHLKCDGQQPVCGRCMSGQLTCEYTPSRRGYKGPSKKRRADPPPTDLHTTPDPRLFPLDAPKTSDWHLPGTVGPLSSQSTPPDIGTTSVSLGFHHALTARSPLTPESSSTLGTDGYLVDVYYSHFHSAHPILPPLHMLYHYHPPQYLERVIKFIGTHFTTAASPETYRPNVVVDVTDAEPGVEKVQALLLLTIVLHSRNERQEAGALLAQAMDLAYELGIHLRSFAETMAEGDPIREESFRRTWWELFVIEGMLTALGARATFTASTVPLEVPLPCEERIYQDGLYPPASPPTIAQFDDRVFADEDFDFSSYSYRIEAVRILGRVVSLSETPNGHQEMVESVDARIASWFHHLPESKSELMLADGTVDEMMFQAKMVINGASIYLHFPRSDLLSSPAVAAEVICGHSGICLMPAFSHHSHAMKAVKAASEISNLAAIRIPETKHTPFFICALVLSSIVQLAAYSVKAGQMPDPRRDRLSLTVGVFKSLGRTWAISQTVNRQIKAVARDVLDIGMRPAPDPVDFITFLDGQFWLPNPQVA